MRRKTNWRTSPSGLRLRAYLEAGNTGTCKDLAEAVHCSCNNVWELIQGMREDGAAHIVRWVRNTTGPCIPSFAWGNRPDETRKPRPYSKAEKARRYRAKLRRDLGDEVAARVTALMSRPTASALVMEGRKVWQRGVGVMREAA